MFFSAQFTTLLFIFIKLISAAVNTTPLPPPLCSFPIILIVHDDEGTTLNSQHSLNMFEAAMVIIRVVNEFRVKSYLPVLNRPDDENCAVLK